MSRTSAILPVEKWIRLNLISNENKRDGASVGGILMKNAGVAALKLLSNGKYSLLLTTVAVLLAQRKLTLAWRCCCTGLVSIMSLHLHPRLLR